MEWTEVGDHCFGKAALAGPGVTIYEHEWVPVALRDWDDAGRSMLAERSREYAAEMAELVIMPPTETFASRLSLDLGDRVVELVHLGRGYTRGDIVIRVPQADVAVAGDLINSSGPPAYSPARSRWSGLQRSRSSQGLLWCPDIDRWWTSGS